MVDRLARLIDGGQVVSAREKPAAVAKRGRARFEVVLQELLQRVARAEVEITLDTDAIRTTERFEFGQ